MDNNGRIIQGQIGANNVSDLEVRLERMSLDLINYQTKKIHSNNSGNVTRRELITFCFYMENLTHAGVPLLDGLNDLRDTLPQGRFREIISSLIESIDGGDFLSEAMADFPDIFDQVFVTLIRSGEESGRLNDIFQHLTETLKWQDEMIATAKKAIIYPSIMAVVISAAVFFIMIYLVPKLVTFIRQAGAELPFHTEILIMVSDFFGEYWFFILLTPVLIFFFIKIGVKVSTPFHFLMDRLKLRIWIVGGILEKIILARFTTFFALLYESGITVLDSLAISKNLADNLVVEKALQEVTNNIQDGMSISESFEKANLFPPLVLRMVAIGESTGELDKALSNVSYFYERDVKEAIDKLQSMIEPIMTIILGLILGWVILSVLGPIYDVIVDMSGSM